MNLVLDDAQEITIKSNRRVSLGRILLKGDTVSVLTAVPSAKPTG
jgi:small nuclear ribonucleoprotein (snRNP)-like protein